MKLLHTLTPTGLKDPPKYRKFYSDVAMTHPGRMRVVTALEALKFLYPSTQERQEARVLDIFFGAGTTAIAAGLLGFNEILGFDIDPTWMPETVKTMQEFFEHIQITIAKIDADEGSQYFFEEWADLLFCSPEFPNSHSQGKSAMQTCLRRQKQTVAGTEYGSGKNWRGEKNFCKRLTAALQGSSPLVRRSGRAAVHIKNYVRDNKEKRADLWVAEVLETCGFVVEGYINIPLTERSKFQNDQRFPLRKIKNTDKKTLTDLLECGHIKVRDRPPDVWPSSARCVDCGPIPNRVEILEERIVVARRVR